MEETEKMFVLREPFPGVIAFKNLCYRALYQHYDPGLIDEPVI